MSYRVSLTVLLAAMASFSSLCRADEALNLENPGFEADRQGWVWGKEDSESELSRVTTESAYKGKLGLSVIVADGEQAPMGSSVLSNKVPVEPGSVYRMTFYARCNEKSGIGVMLQFYNEGFSIVGDAKQILPMEVGDWTEYKVEAPAPPNAAYAAIFIHSWSRNRCNVDFDDFTISKVTKP
ncbi:MAG: hypothetical protein BGO12_03785 [Verrucomicrobia bacterium 61-8]|nr:hypothetical protein [Verrucomicrobiota bacterium]OJV03639.1 MAG: hypothetical protein BGO12_03785 [Verrucomicrobia bacterium 61-8]